MAKIVQFMTKITSDNVAMQTMRYKNCEIMQLEQKKICDTKIVRGTIITNDAQKLKAGNLP